MVRLLLALAAVAIGCADVAGETRGFLLASSQELADPVRAAAEEPSGPPGVELRGVVLDQCGRPVTDLWVHAARGLKRGGATNHRGEFLLESVVPGEAELTLESDRLVDGPVTVMTSTDEAERRLVVSVAPRVRGRVVDDRGEPHPRFSVDDLPVRDEQGRFSIDVDTQRLIDLSAPDSATRTVDPAKGTAAGCGELDVGTVVLGKGREVTGRVVDAVTSAPIAGARVEVPTVAVRARQLWGYVCGNCVRDDLKVRPIVTDANGGFRYPHLADDQPKLTVWVAGYVPETVDVAAGTATLQVGLRRGATVAGRLFDPRGEPLAATLELYNRGVPMVRFRDRNKVPRSLHQSAQAGSDGKFVLSGLSGGTYRVVVQSPNVSFTLYESRLTVPPEGRVVHDFAPRRGGVHVTVSIGRRNSMRYYLVDGGSVRPGSLAELERLLVDAWRPKDLQLGQRVFLAIPAGAHTLLMIEPRPDDVRVSAMPITVGTTDVEVTLQPADTLTLPRSR